MIDVTILPAVALFLAGVGGVVLDSFPGVVSETMQPRTVGELVRR